MNKKRVIVIAVFILLFSLSAFRIIQLNIQAPNKIIEVIYPKNTVVELDKIKLAITKTELKKDDQTFTCLLECMITNKENEELTIQNFVTSKLRLSETIFQFDPNSITNKGNLVNLPGGDTEKFEMKLILDLQEYEKLEHGEKMIFYINPEFYESEFGSSFLRREILVKGIEL